MPLGVVLPLRQLVVVEGMAFAVQIVADLAVAEVHRVDHRLPVHGILQRLAHQLVVERWQIELHHKTAHRPDRRLQDTEIAVAGQRLGPHRADLVSQVHLTAEQRVLAGGDIDDRQDLELVKIGQVVLPIVVIAGVHRRLARPERLEYERPCADRGRKVHRAVLHDVDGVTGQRARQVGDGLAEREFDGQVVDAAGVGEVHEGEVNRAVQRQLRIKDAPYAVQHIVGDQRLAVMPGDPVAQPDAPLRPIRIGLDRSGQPAGRREIRVVAHKPLEAVVGPGEVDEVRALMRIERLLLGAA